MKRWIAALACIALSSCGSAQDAAAPSTEMATLSPAGGAAGKSETGVKVALPQIAYSYRYGFDVPSGAIAKVQDAHVALCDRLGIVRCRVVEMQRSSADEGGARGSLKLQVDAGIARAFGGALAKAVEGAGGGLSDSSTTSEDLSKQIVDTEARLRSKEALTGRLMQLLQTRNGSVAELVEAERKVAEVQEEIDAARSWLAEMRGRVSMSAIDIDYDGGAGGSFVQPIREAFGDIGGLIGTSIGALILFVAGAIPWALLIAAIVWAIRRIVRRRRARAVPAPAPVAE